MDLKRAQDFMKQAQPDSNNLVVLGIIAVIIYSIYALGGDSKRIVDTAIGGLLGYLGSSKKA